MQDFAQETSNLQENIIRETEAQIDENSDFDAEDNSNSYATISESDTDEKFYKEILMTLTLEQWKEILDAVNSSGGNILEAIKEKLKEKHEDTYQEWEGKDFNVNHLYDMKLALVLIAAVNGHTNVVNALLKAEKIDVNAKDKNEQTLLHLVAFKGHVDVVNALIEAGAKIDEKGANGRTPLHLAAVNGHTNVVNALLKAEKIDVNAKDKNERTPLYLATFKGHTNVVNALIEAGAKVDEKRANGCTLLHLAAVKGHIDVVNALIEAGAKIDEKGANGYTPLHLAIFKGHTNVVNALLKAEKIDVNAKDKNIIQPLKEAETKQIISRAIKIGATLGTITLLTVGIGCSIAGVELSILAIAGIAVAAALVIGVIAGGITYSVSKPSNKLDKPDLEVADQQVPEKA